MRIESALLIGLGMATALGTLGCTTMKRTNYPQTRKVDQVDSYHGRQVSDPYRWLEDDRSADTLAWVESQNRVTFDFLGGIPERDGIRSRLTQLWNYERHGIPYHQGGRYFFTRNNGLQNQAVILTARSLTEEPVVLLDPNTLSSDGTVALSSYSISEDGALMAYGLSSAGSDWQEWHVRDVATGKDQPDIIKWVKFSSASWMRDGSGFFYSRYAEPEDKTALTRANYFHKLYYHKLGTPQSQDELIYERADHKDWNFGGSVTEDGRFLLISATQGTSPKRRILYRDLQKPGSPVVMLLMDFDAAYSFIDNDGRTFWFRTDLNAPRGRVIAIDLDRPERPNWKELIPEAAETLVGVNVVNHQFIGDYLKDAHSQVKVFGLDGRFVREIALPGIGSTGGFGGRRSDTETFYSFTGYATPTVIYRHDLATGQSTVLRQPKVAFDPSGYETRQVFYPSKDGTRVPMFLVHRKGWQPDGKAPVYLYGYGGFNISLTPAFSPAYVVWLEMGGVLAIPNLRGGGEYGETWHKAGTKLQKQNVFDDFIAAAEWLIANNYTRPSKLAIAGGSNGGLLVGACMTQRPELFGATLPAVGVMDMLRFQKFTIGWAWTSDYGSSDDPSEFKALLAYSPYHNLRPGVKYPPTLVTTADHDDRVVPAHSFKFAARLQECQAGAAPVLIRIETRAGHGAGKPTAKIIEETADKWAFLVRSLGMHPRLDEGHQGTTQPRPN